MLETLLQIHGEGDNLDFKELFSLDSQKERAAIIRDILAFANTEDGGHIIFGIDKYYNPVGLPDDVHIDTTKIYNTINKYIIANLQLMAAEYEIQMPGWPEKKRIGILYIPKYPSIVVPRCEVAYQDEKNKTITVVRKNQLLVRIGAQSCEADQVTYDQLFGRTYSRSESVHPLEGELPSSDEVTIEFVGRIQELDELRTWFNDPYAKRWFLTGYGGKGKTAIAYEFAKEIQTDAPKGFDYLLWLTAKERRFEEGSILSKTPNFFDEPSLLDAIIKGYGFDEYLELPLYEKREQVIKLLRELPALLIADDIDSLESLDSEEREKQKAFMFLVSEVGSTSSKVLFTTRRVASAFSYISTEVYGLSNEEGEQFIRSRIRLFHLDREFFTYQIINDILKVTEGSPLYVEDLLRFCKTLDPIKAIEEWKKRGGDEARRYALQREFDGLTPLAKEIVLACCIPGIPISLTEIQVITGRSLDQIISEMSSIQNLFLVSRPKLIDGEARFDVNMNMRRLILNTYQNVPTFSNLKKRYDGLLGRINIKEKNNIASYNQKAVSFQRLGQHEEAEHLLLTALARYPNNPDLTAQLGMIYSHWLPTRRLADARDQFKLATKLGCRQEWMYRAWARMEIDDEAWSAAIEAAEAGINAGYKTKELYSLAGLAHSLYGQYWKRNFQYSRAEQEWLLADELLRLGLKDPEELADYAERKQNSRVFRALVINCEQLGQTKDMYRFLDEWQREYPNDPFVSREVERISNKYPRPARKTDKR